MATSPFELFRRNLKPLMIALTVLAMFAFVVLPALQSYQQMNRPGGPAQTTVASYDGGTFDINEIDYFNRNHNLTLRFLSALAEKTMERGGIPQVPGFAQDPQSGAIQSLGINSNVSRQAAVTAKLFAERAEKMGMQLDDAALRSWLDRYVDGKLTAGEINGILTAATDNQLGQFHLYEQLRTHLLASAAQQVVSAGLVGGNQWLTTPPAEQFDLFRRLNQQAVITAYPVLVHDYLDKVTAEPTEAELEALYEEGKERYPDEMSSKPAFRRPATRTFEYVTANTEKFIEEEMKTISEDELRAEYEQQLEGGEFRLPETPDGFSPQGLDLSPSADSLMPDPSSAENETAPADDDAPDDETSADDAPRDDAGNEVEMSLDEAAAAEEASPAEASPAEASPAEASPAEETAEPTEAETPADDAAEPTASEQDRDGEADDNEASSEQGEPEEQGENAESEENASRNRLSNPVRLVALTAQDENADSPSDSPSDAADEPAEVVEEDEDSPAEPSEAETTKETATETADPTVPEDEPAETDAAADAAPAENGEPMQEPEDAQTPSADTPESEAAEAEGEVEPEPPSFEEVREDIARQLASTPANEKARAATRKVNDAMRRYFTRKAIYEGGAGKTGEPPVRPDLEAMAEELGLEYVKTKPLNQFELQDHPLGRTATRGEGMRGGDRLPSLVFEGNVPIESPVQTENPSTGQPYVSWVIAATEESVPEFSEVREEVVAHWREQQARELAEKAAQDLATKANESDQPLSELVPEDRKSLVAEEIGPFPWMLWLGPGRRPIEWRVQELDRTGEGFMRQVFFQPLDQFGAAPNAPKTVYYTVKTSERTPPMEELRERFLRSDERRPVTALAGETIGEIQRGYFVSFQKELGLEWTDE